MRVTLRRRLDPRDERGATLLIVVLCLIAIFGMVVLVVDIGGALVVRQQMIRSADSASLAAAQSFAIDESLCGTDEVVAQQQAGLFAVNNATGTSVIGFTTDCDASTVTVDVESAARQFFFAPILGGPSQRNVHATATALWGPAGGGNPLPIELDPILTQNCVFEDDGVTPKEPGACPEGFWFNNQDLTNSGWGLMNLNTWGQVEYDDSCTNAGGENDLDGWIRGADSTPVSLEEIPTYVCTANGSKTTAWFDALISLAGTGKVVYFPVNDPDAMNTQPGHQKYAIVGFTPMKVVDVLEGDDPAAIGTIGDSGTCSKNNQNIGALANFSLDVFAGTGGGCPSSAPDNIPIGGVHIFPRTGPEFVKCSAPGAGCDYWYEESTHTVHWLGGAVPQARIRFDWSFDGTAGACGIHDSDPNAKCLLLEFAGVQAGGTIPWGGEDFGLRAIRLLK